MLFSWKVGRITSNRLAWWANEWRNRVRRIDVLQWHIAYVCRERALAHTFIQFGSVCNVHWSFSVLFFIYFFTCATATNCVDDSAKNEDANRAECVVNIMVRYVVHRRVDDTLHTYHNSEICTAKGSNTSNQQIVINGEHIVTQHACAAHATT